MSVSNRKLAAALAIYIRYLSLYVYLYVVACFAAASAMFVQRYTTLFALLFADCIRFSFGK